MKSYILRAGCRYSLVEECAGRLMFSAEIARNDIIFEDKQLVHIDTVDRMLHFHVGNRHFYTGTDSISVLH